MSMYSKQLCIGVAFAICVAVAVTYAAPARAEDAAQSDAVSRAAAKAAAVDPMLQAMQQELARERRLLLLPGSQRPYFVEYRLDDFRTWDAASSYGAITREERNHQRVVRVTVKVGDRTTDSSSSSGDGALQLAPEDNDPDALRYALWTATDSAYKAALKAYAAKQAALKRFEKPPTEKDFSAEAAVIRIEPIVQLSIDEGAWKDRINMASGAVLHDPDLRADAGFVQYSGASVSALVVNHLLVNSEGTVLRHGYGVYSAQYGVGGQAADGMQLSRSNGSTAPTGDGLESAAAFHQRVVDDVRSFAALRQAPVVDAEDFHGPVLFSGDAACDVFNTLFVPNVLAQRPAMGTTARTTGAYQSSYHSRVLSPILNVVDDPTRSAFERKALVGAYAIDDEGVPAEAVTVVEQGKLMNYLVGRTPIRDFPNSNGHGRAVPAQAPHAAEGVMIFSAVKPLSAAQMHAKLLAMAQEQKRDVYEAETLAGIAPRVLYRVHPDGSRELVRGAVFDELDTRSLRSDIVAAGSDEYVQNRSGPLPQTTIAPSILFDDVGVKRATEQQAKLPYYAPPELESK